MTTHDVSVLSAALLLAGFGIATLPWLTFLAERRFYRFGLCSAIGATLMVVGYLTQDSHNLLRATNPGLVGMEVLLGVGVLAYLTSGQGATEE